MPLSEDDKSEGSVNADGIHERRKHINLREIFEEACRLTAPFYDAENGWGNASLTMYAQQTLRDAYPDLLQQEIAMLSAVVERFHKKQC